MDELEIEELEDPPLRRADEAAARCVVLRAVVEAGHGVSKHQLVQWLSQEGLWEKVSPEEQGFLKTPASTEQQIINATWRTEAIYALLWALGRTSDLTSLSEPCDVPRLLAMLPTPMGDTSDFITTARMREDEQIHAGLKDVYEAHWSIRDAAINGREAPTKLDVGVVSERHLALNWLVYSDEEWDEVTTDT